MNVRQRLQKLGVARTDAHRFERGDGTARSAMRRIDLVDAIPGRLLYPDRAHQRLCSSCHFVVLCSPLSALIIINDKNEGDSVTQRAGLIGTLLYQRWAYQLARVPLVIEHDPDAYGAELWDRITFTWRDGVATRPRWSPCGTNRSRNSARSVLMTRRRRILISQLNE